MVEHIVHDIIHQAPTMSSSDMLRGLSALLSLGVSDKATVAKLLQSVWSYVAVDSSLGNEYLARLCDVLHLSFPSCSAVSYLLTTLMLSARYLS